MSNWYVRSDDIKLKDGTTKKQYHLVFETYSEETKEEVEKYFTRIMDSEMFLSIDNNNSRTERALEEACELLSKWQPHSAYDKDNWKEWLLKDEH